MHRRQKLIDYQREIDKSAIILEISPHISHKWTDPAGRESARM